MIQVIAGKKGSGKTKRLIDLTNTTAREAAHDVVFLDDDNRYMFDVDRKVRFINAEEYHISSADMFIGFLCGILSSNFDVGTVFIDAANSTGAFEVPERSRVSIDGGELMDVVHVETCAHFDGAVHHWEVKVK